MRWLKVAVTAIAATLHVAYSFIDFVLKIDI